MVVIIAWRVAMSVVIAHHRERSYVRIFGHCLGHSSGMALSNRLSTSTSTTTNRHHRQYRGRYGMSVHG